MTAIVHTEGAAPSYALRAPIAQMLQGATAKAAIMPLLPRGVSYEQVIVEVYRAWTQNKEIAECTPASIVIAVSKAVQTGLEIGRTVHLVPVNEKISKRGEEDAWEKRLQAWNDYKGDIELVLATGAARHIDANAVHANDRFDYELGDAPFVKHAPALANRGALIGAYAIAHITSTLKKIDVMGLDEIEAVRAKSKKWASLKSCPPWYAVKSVLHRVTKTLPKNPRLRGVLATIEEQQALIEGDREIDISHMIEATEETPGDVMGELE